MNRSAIRRIAWLFSLGIVFFLAISLFVPRNYENRYLLTESNLCSVFSWDTGYGFNENQTQTCDQTSPVEVFKPLISLRTFTRLMLVQKIKITGPAEAKYWLANKFEKIELQPVSREGNEQIFSVEDITFVSTARPFAAYFWRICGIILLAGMLTWLLLETHLLSQLAIQKRLLGIGVLVIVAWGATFFNLLATFPGLLNPFDPTSGMSEMAEYGFPGYVRTTYFTILFSVMEVFGQVWSPIVFVSMQTLAVVLFAVRQFLRKQVSQWILLAVTSAIFASPLVLAYNVFLEKNITCAWTSLLLFVVAYFVVLERLEKKIWVTLVGSIICLLFQASTVLYFPALMAAYALRWDCYKKPVLYSAFYLFFAFGARPFFLTMGQADSSDYENYERISLLRYPTDLQYDCAFPVGFFSAEINRLTNIDEVKEKAKRCEGRPIVHDSPTKFSISHIRGEILRAFLIHPEMVLASRVRLFFGIVGTHDSGFGEWDAWHDKFKHFRQISLDLGQLRNPERGAWKIAWVNAIKKYSMYPYQSYYLGLIVVIGTLFFWSVFPASFAVSLMYSTKILTTFLMAPTTNNFYLFDLYVLGFIIPIMIYTESLSRKTI